MYTSSFLSYERTFLAPLGAGSKHLFKWLGGKALYIRRTTISLVREPASLICLAKFPLTMSMSSCPMIVMIWGVIKVYWWNLPLTYRSAAYVESEHEMGMCVIDALRLTCEKKQNVSVWFGPMYFHDSVYCFIQVMSVSTLEVKRLDGKCPSRDRKNRRLSMKESV